MGEKLEKRSVKVLLFSNCTAECMVQVLKKMLEFEVMQLQVCYKFVGSHSNSTPRGSDVGMTH